MVVRVCGLVSKFKKEIRGFTKQVYTFLLTIGQQNAHRNCVFSPFKCNILF